MGRIICSNFRPILPRFLWNWETEENILHSFLCRKAPRGWVLAAHMVTRAWIHWFSGPSNNCKTACRSTLNAFTSSGFPGEATAPGTSLAPIPRCSPRRWAFHGARDELAPVAHSRDMINAIRKAGGNPKYTEYEFAGHGIWDKVREEGIMEWMFAQHKE